MTSEAVKLATVGSCEVLVVDSAAFIKSAKLERLGSEVYTIREVIGELRDSQTRSRMEGPLPYELKFKEPSSEALNAVITFSKKTGDFNVLSLTDLKVLALTWMLEKEKNGITHLRTEPIKQIRVLNRAAPTIVAQGINSGFFYAKKSSDGQFPWAAAPVSQTSHLSALPISISDYLSSNDREEYAQKVSQKSIATAKKDELNEEFKYEYIDVAKNSGSTSKTNQTSSENEKIAEKEGDIKEIINTEDENENAYDKDSDANEEDGSDEEEEDQNWITPDNVHLADAVWKAAGNSSVAPAERVSVGCITTDFAMQNVLIQMGLHVISLEGMVIKRAKQYVLKCHACFKITTEMHREFCPTCGNNTLIRISVSVDDSGVITHYHSPRAQQISLRGTKYSIPLPKGGRNNQDLILREDQKELMIRKQQSRQHHQRHKGADAFDQDFIAQASPFAFVDVRAKMLENSTQIGYGKRNPNESRKRLGKKKAR